MCAQIKYIIPRVDDAQQEGEVSPGVGTIGLYVPGNQVTFSNQTWSEDRIYLDNLQIFQPFFITQSFTARPTSCSYAETVGPAECSSPGTRIAAAISALRSEALPTVDRADFGSVT